MNKIEAWYDNEYEEWTRLDRHKIEFEITKRYLDEYIVGEGLEIGCALSQDKNVMGTSQHFLYIGKK